MNNSASSSGHNSDSNNASLRHLGHQFSAKKDDSNGGVAAGAPSSISAMSQNTLSIRKATNSAFVKIDPKKVNRAIASVVSSSNVNS